MLPMQGAWGSIPGQGSRSHMLQLRPNTVKEEKKKLKKKKDHKYRIAHANLKINSTEITCLESSELMILGMDFKH